MRMSPAVRSTTSKEAFCMPLFSLRPPSRLLFPRTFTTRARESFNSFATAIKCRRSGRSRRRYTLVPFRHHPLVGRVRLSNANCMTAAHFACCNNASGGRGANIERTLAGAATFSTHNRVHKTGLCFAVTASARAS